MKNKINEDDIDYFITMGDNIYPVNQSAPTIQELDLMLSLFKGESVKDLPIYAIRGNHDCAF